MPFLALAINDKGKEHLEAGGDMKCSDFKRLYTKTDRCAHLSHARISIHTLYAHTYNVLGRPIHPCANT